MASTKKIDETAADWVARLDGSDPPPQLRAEFAAWRQADPRHYAAYLRLEHVWDRLDRLRALQAQTPLPDSREAAPEIDLGDRSAAEGIPRSASGATGAQRRKSREAPTARRGTTRGDRASATAPGGESGAAIRRASSPPVVLSRVAAAAVLLGAAVGLWLWLWPQGLGLGAPERRYVTPVGGFARVAFADGTVVQLNTSSEVRVVLGKKRRDVRLVQGEATFAVARDPVRPFVVTADATAVQAVGTNFNVRRISRGIEVMIMEGAVAVGPVAALNQPDALPVVGAGRIAVTAASQVQTRDIDAGEMTRRLAWQRGMLGFDGQPLAEVAEEFNRYNDRKLVVASPSVAQLRIGGYFRATNLEAFVAVIEERFGISVSREPGRIILRGSVRAGVN